MTLNALQTRPLYLQVRDVLAQGIATGRWKPGIAMPNELDLAREYGVSTGTMRKSLDLMEIEHLITRQQGRGTFVNDQASDEFAVRFSNIRTAEGERVTGQVELGEVSEGAASEFERTRLKLQTNEMVYRVRCVRLHLNRPFMVEEASMPAALFPRLTEINGFPHAIVALAQKNGILVGKAEERIAVHEATPTEAEALGIAPSSPVMVLDRVLLTLEGRPIEWRVGKCHLQGQYYQAEIS